MRSLRGPTVMYLTDYLPPGGQSRGYICRYLFQDIETEAAALHTHPPALPPIHKHLTLKRTHRFRCVLFSSLRSAARCDGRAALSSSTLCITQVLSGTQRHSVGTQRSISLSGAFRTTPNSFESDTTQSLPQMCERRPRVCGVTDDRLINVRGTLGALRYKRH